MNQHDSDSNDNLLHICTRPNTIAVTAQGTGGQMLHLIDANRSSATKSLGTCSLTRGRQEGRPGRRRLKLLRQCSSDKVEAKNYDVKRLATQTRKKPSQYTRDTTRVPGICCFNTASAARKKEEPISIGGIDSTWGSCISFDVSSTAQGYHATPVAATSVPAHITSHFTHCLAALAGM